VAHLLAAVGCLATWWIIEVGARFARLPAATLPWLPSWRPDLAAVALALITVMVVLLTLRLPEAEATPALSVAGSRRSVLRRPRPATALLVALVGLGIGVWWGAPWVIRTLGEAVPWPSGRAPPADWTLAQCDVGQGDALVVRSGLAHAVLIDAGPDADAIDRCLDRLGVRVLDLVVLSHFHADHVIGLAGALRGRSCSEVVAGSLEEPATNAAVVHEVLARAGVPLVTLTVERGLTLGSDGWRLRSDLVPPLVSGAVPMAGSPPTPDPASTPDPGAATVSSDAPSPDGLINDASLVALVEITTPRGSVIRLAALGDLESAGQARLLLRSSQVATAVDVVKVAHHGSAKQDPDLYRRLAPRIALIGVGRDNDYGHPAPSALSMLARLGILAYRTDRDHTVLVAVGPPAATGWAPPLTVTRGR